MKNQSGSGIIQILLIIIIIGMIGATGWYVWNNRNLDLATENSQTAKTSQNDEVSDPAEEDEFEEIDEFLVIEEWGVQLPLSASIREATYKIKTTDEGAQYAELSTKQLDEENPVCDDADGVRYNEYGIFQSITRNVGSDPTVDGSLVADDYNENPDSYTKIGEFYYSFTHGNGFECSSKNSVLAQYRQAFNGLEAISN